VLFGFFSQGRHFLFQFGLQLFSSFVFGNRRHHFFERGDFFVVR
jgi:hypothetical protein